MTARPSNWFSRQSNPIPAAGCESDTAALCVRCASTQIFCRYRSYVTICVQGIERCSAATAIASTGELITLTARERPEPPESAVSAPNRLPEGAFCASADWPIDSAQRCDQRKCTDLTKVEIRPISSGDLIAGSNSPELTRHYATGQHPTTQQALGVHLQGLFRVTQRLHRVPRNGPPGRSASPRCLAFSFGRS